MTVPVDKVTVEECSVFFLQEEWTGFTVHHVLRSYIHRLLVFNPTLRSLLSFVLIRTSLCLIRLWVLGNVRPDDDIIKTECQTFYKLLNSLKGYCCKENKVHLVNTKLCMTYVCFSSS